MTPELRALERCASTYRLLLPRSAHRGRVGGVAGRRAGGSLELHDFREYQPGDDLRQIDWNAVARTDQLVVRVRREEVSPRVEIVLDASRSMGVDDAKRERARTLARLFFRLARQEGLAPALVVAADRATRWREVDEAAFEQLPFDAVQPLPQSVAAQVLRPCGVRIVVSDWLFETSFVPLLARLCEGASQLSLVQVLSAEDVDPPAAGTVALIDSESGERLERELTPDVVEAYQRRLAAHHDVLVSAARHVRGSFSRVVATQSLESACRDALLGRVLEVQG